VSALRHVSASHIEAAAICLRKGRRWDWVDPAKDQAENVLGVENGFTTRRRVLADRGYDLEDTLAELADEQALIERYGLRLGTDAKGVADTASDDQQSQDGGSDGSRKSKGDAKD
jgi:capsid protein